MKSVWRSVATSGSAVCYLSSCYSDSEIARWQLLSLSLSILFSKDKENYTSFLLSLSLSLKYLAPLLCLFVSFQREESERLFAKRALLYSCIKVGGLYQNEGSLFLPCEGSFFIFHFSFLNEWVAFCAWFESSNTCQQFFFFFFLRVSKANNKISQYFYVYL